jgi:hypothetical protein
VSAGLLWLNTRPLPATSEKIKDSERAAHVGAVHPGIGSLVFGCGWVQEHGGKSSHFPAISLSGPHPLAYWHLSNVIEHVGCVHLFPAANSPEHKQTDRGGMTSANDTYAAASIAAAETTKITAMSTAAHM